MKFRHLIILMALVCLSCSQEATTIATVDYKIYFDAWLKNQGYDQLPKTPLGCYILKDIPGEGPLVDNGKDTLYVRTDFTRKYVGGTVVTSTDDSLARIVGGFDTTYFYGPRILSLIKGTEFSGLIDALRSMNIGGYRKVVIPGWLMTTDVYSTAEEYQNNCTGTEALYEFRPVEAIDNIKKWEVDSLCRFVTDYFQGTVDPKDTTDSNNNKYGFYYKRTVEPTSETSLLKDTTIYINYTCYLLNGKVVDTTIEKIAKDAGFDTSGRTYSPVSIQMNETYTSITMGSSSSSAITGFTLTLSKMHPYESGTSVFYSAYGYKAAGSGFRIPPYASLRFDIDIVDKP